MGKQSSAKKVNRAARVGGTTSSRTTPKLGFPFAVAAVVLIGVALVVFAVFQKSGDDVSPTLDDHWHSAQGVWLCEAFDELPLSDTRNDEVGIHTHDDGLIHIHPFSSNATGEDATLGVFADEVGLEFGEDSFTLPDGREFKTGDDCQGEAGEVVVLKWSAGALDEEPEVIRTDFADVGLTANGEAFTIAFMKPDQDLLALLPPAVANLNTPSDLAPGETIEPVEIPDASGATTTPAGAESAEGLGASGDTTPAGSGDTTATTGP